MSAAPADLALSLLAAKLLQRVARLLGEYDIPVMPLKGALWQRTLYSASERRPLVDVDVIVPTATFGLAREALRRAGFAAMPNPQGDHEQAFELLDWPLALDLHRTVFARGRYRLDNAGIFARARPDEVLFDAKIWIPHPLDQLAHLIGHLATDHRPGDAVYRQDFERLVARSGLQPEDAAQHLVRHGLGRAARFALPELATTASESWARRCHASLGADPLGERFARSARYIVARQGRFSPWSTVAGHALNSSLARSLTSLAWAAAGRFRATRL